MLTLASGESSLVVAPEHGAGVVGWMLGSTPILRRGLPQASARGDRYAMGCFPLVPYGNRIAQARFVWRGTEYRLKRNFGDQPHSIHGLGWQRAWSLAEVTPGSVALTLDHRPDESWPFAFTAFIRYSLSGPNLTVAIQMTNRHHAPAPAGIGLHPHFPKLNDPALRFEASGAWRNGPDSLPLRHGAPPAEWRHGDPRPVVHSRLDNCFTGWDGTADIVAGPASLRIESSGALRQLQVFTPSWADFFCVEPVSQIPDAINRPNLPADQAMHILEPNKTLGATIRLCPTGGSRKVEPVKLYPDGADASCLSEPHRAWSMPPRGR
jgi:aldose 1-epimerase